MTVLQRSFYFDIKNLIIWKKWKKLLKYNGSKYILTTDSKTKLAVLMGQRRKALLFWGDIMNNIQTVERKYQKGNLDQSAILNLLRKRGYRITKQRQNLIEIILEENCSSCKEIYIKAAKKDSGIGMATIYRMMNLLEELGALKWRNQYCICDAEQAHLEACTVEMEDTSKVELNEKTIRKVFEKGMEACGYTEGKKVKHVVVKEKQV